jgi:hypothetical protein
MATCPQCGNFLDVRHRCAGVWRLRLGVGRRLLVGALIGALVGELVFAVTFGGTSLPSIALAGSTGALVTWSLLTGEPRTSQD